MCTSWLVLFDDNGVDTLIPWTEVAEETMLSTLSGEPPAINGRHLVSMVMIRAQLNNQRNTEVWAFNTQEDMNVDEMHAIWKNWDIAPLKELVRSKGSKLY